MTPLRILIALFLLAVLFVGSTFWINAWYGCYPWSPKEVPFHQGMTICPGQTAVGTASVTVQP